MEYFTLKQVSERIASRKEDVDLAMRRVRYWTNEKLIYTLDEPHSGKGRHRRYDQEGLMVAAILWELSRYNVPIGILEKIHPALNDLVDQYNDEVAEEIMSAKIALKTLSGKSPLWLAVMHDENSGNFRCSYIRVKSGIQQIMEDDSAIILNVQKITNRVNNP
jgi:DNA-binding transcriptional MerR regulator